MAMLKRQDILAAQDLPRAEEPVEEWGAGATVALRAITAAEFDRFQLSLAARRNDPDGMHNMRCRFLVFCLIDEAGQRLFGDDEADLLGAKNRAPIERLYEKAQALSGLGPKAIEEAEKN